MGVNRTLVTQMLVNLVGDIADKQDQKGIKEYGKSLDQVPFEAYDWNVMALEETIDALKYLIVENVKLKDEVDRLTKTLYFRESKIDALLQLNRDYKKQLHKHTQIWTNEGDL